MSELKDKNFIKMKRICKTCNKEFKINPYAVKLGKGLYCSKECSNKSPEHCKKMSNLCRGGKNGFYGKKHSAETKLKMIEAHKNRDKDEMKEISRKAGLLGAKKRWDGHIKVGRKYTYPRRKFEKGKGLEKKRFTNQRYKARKRNAIGNHNFGEWELLKKQYNFICPACSRQEPQIKLTEDHIVPLSKGGSDNIENIQPLCISCNVRKHTKIIKYLPISDT